MRTARMRTVAVAGAVALALAGCQKADTVTDGSKNGNGSASSSHVGEQNDQGNSQGKQPGNGSQNGAAQAPATGDARLSKFYTQKPVWETCSDNSEGASAKCAWVKVPIDYSKPDGKTVKLRVLKVAANGAKNGQAPRGALLVNPGGPGASATQYAMMADFIVSGTIRKNYDIVGFDPRGVGKSSPMKCLDDASMDAVMGADPTPDDQREIEIAYGGLAKMGKGCQQKYPDLVGHVSTAEAARDMDVVRSVLGQPKLNYLGKSYGTYLGATYAGLFPKNVGNMILDGVMPPDLTSEQVSLGQAAGFESATRAWAKSCTSSGKCPLGNDVESVMKGLKDFFKQLDSKPLPVSGNPRIKELTEGWATIGVAQAMYTKTYWDTLTEALQSAKDGDGTPLFALASEYASRDDNGEYENNTMQVINAVNCLDRGAQRWDEAQLKSKKAEFESKAPVWGGMMSFGGNSCAAWPVPATGKIDKVSAQGSGPIVVIGTTRDPATPYEWAKRLHDQLSNSRLISHEGDGHTAYKTGSSCVDQAVDGYLMNGTPPKDGLSC
ncbi:Tripeptidyl aminopeptidase precursor [Dermatophilus congolensis]|uniref:Tripeptidyl aminopeptidase n=2 Tax=Dermatophilus congolensis TaxID=1863 RepID=A0A239VAK2_9MICO|nr:Tripeptidyl aminopeptidase precursor [Dermatophilus congolensis]